MTKLPKIKACLFGAVLMLTSFPSLGFATERVEVDYMLNCQGCHLPDGRGFPDRQVPSLTDHMGKFLAVEGGRAFLVQVPGAATSDLSDGRLADVLNWMLEKFSASALPENFVPYTAGEVAILRAEPLSSVADVRAELIEKIQELEAGNDVSDTSGDVLP